MPDFVSRAKREPCGGYCCATDPEAAWVDTWDGFVRARQAGWAASAVASQSGGEVEFRLGDDVVCVTAIGPSTQNDPCTWLDALDLVMICRDQARINALAGVPIAVLRAAGSDDDCMYAMVRMWQGYWTGADDLIELILDAMRAADPELVVHSAPRAVLRGAGQLHRPAQGDLDQGRRE